MRTVDPSNANRQRIHSLIKRQPDIHLTTIMSITGLAQGSVRYHVNNLIKDGLIDKSLRPKRGPDPKNGRKPAAPKSEKRKYVAMPKAKPTTKGKARERALQRRIDKIVEAAEQAKAAAGVDVVYDFRRSFGARVRATKLG
jgi:predicted ArsR family transcriptional regulator